MVDQSAARRTAWCRSCTCNRIASVADPKAFRSGRDFSSWVGLVPKQNSSGGKEKLGNITKPGDRYLRPLFCAGALAVIRYAKIHGTPKSSATSIRDDLQKLFSTSAAAYRAGETGG